MTPEFFLSVGGRALSFAAATGEPIWNFGWSPPETLPDEVQAAHQAAVGRMPRFEIQGDPHDDVEAADLTKLWSHPTVVAALGRPYTGTHQLTGSCFLAGSPVLMTDGSEKPIESVEVGDEVVTHLGRARTVNATTCRRYSGDLIGVEETWDEKAFQRSRRRTVWATACHKFLDPKGGWVELGRATHGVWSPTGLSRELRKTAGVRVEKVKVYCLSVDEDTSFVAGGWAVHNCVGAGGGNVAASLSFVEVILKGDPERCILPFYPYTYGKSRERSGMRGRGEGSTGSGWAEAAIKDGVIDNKLAGLPQPTSYDDGIIWGKDVELSWSDGTRIDGKWIEEGRRHLIQTAAECKSAADVRRAIANGYPVTCASMYAHRPSVEDGILLGRRQGQWSHQMSIQSFMKHPKHGVVYWLHNQWGLRVHGTCPTGMPGGGVWITEADVEWICRTGEVYAFSQYNGYPSQSLDWSLI